MADLHLITISLTPPFPDSGMVTIPIRLTGQDKMYVDAAADQLKLSRAQLMRVLVVRGAERIMKELGLEVHYIQNDNVDLSNGETLID